MTVHLPAIDMTVDLAAGEQMRTEISTKFTPDGVRAELTAAGFEATGRWSDPARDSLLTLARPVVSG